MPTGPRPKHVNVEGTERRHGPRTRRVRPADPAREIRVIVVLRQRPDGPPLPDVEHWARVEPGQRDFLTHEQIAERHGASADDVELIEEHAAAYGLRVVESNLARRSVELSGSIANMGEAFGIELSVFEGPSETYRSYEGPVKLPPALGDVILAVFGLDDRRMARRAGGGSGGPITPPLVAQLYGLPPIPASMAGETVGIFEFGGGYVVDSAGKPTDVDAYVEGLGLPAPDVLAPVPILGGSNVVLGTPGNPGDDAEVALDLEVVASVAPGVKIAVYFIGTNSELGWAAVLGAVAVPGAGQPSPSVVTISWAWDEADWSSSQLTAMSGYFQTAAAHGVSSFAASGDKGSMGNSDETDGRSHVSYPACDPWVTSVGGTSIENVSGLEFDEITWNDNGVTGGGVSTKFGLPSWQVGAGVPPSINDGTTVGRGVPDIAGYANGYEIEIYGQDGGSWWGTSESSPLYAATIAVLNAKLGFRLGYLNPTLYGLATTVGADIFNDIDDDGSNAFTFTEQPPNPPTTITSPGYRATTGWDCCTGWGSIRLDRLYAALAKLPIVATAIAGSGWFGPVCVGSFVDQLLTIDNSGFGTLAISAITSSSPDFVVPDVTGYPLLVAPGDSIDLVLRFLPTGAGPRSAVITIASNDPFAADRVDVSGTGDAPRLSVIVPDSGNLGRVCVGSFAQETVILSNSSRCPLTITAVHSSTGEFLAPTVFSLPLLVGPGGSLPLPVRFAPTTLGAQTGTLTIESDDPAGPRTITLSGDAPAGSLTIAGSSVFGGVKCDTSAQRTVYLCNTGDCTVQLNQVELVQTDPAFRLINDPAPAAIHPGSQLEVVIEYRAIEKEPHPCRLVVHSSDPVRPEIIVDVIAHTVWDGCPGECDDPCRQHGCSCGGRGGCGGCGCGADRHRSHQRHDCNHEEHVH